MGRDTGNLRVENARLARMNEGEDGMPHVPGAFNTRLPGDTRAGSNIVEPPRLIRVSREELRNWMRRRGLSDV